MRGIPSKSEEGEFSFPTFQLPTVSTVLLVVETFKNIDFH